MSLKILQEDNGLVKIHFICTKMDAIWRPTPCHDLGIDGQIEFLEPNTACSTGHIVAVQSKSGPSYFAREDSATVKYYPKHKHRQYWKRLSLPVILILHDPSRDLTIYTRVKNQLNSDGPIVLRKSDIFSPTARSNLLSIVEQDLKTKQPSKILDEFKNATLFREEGRLISGIEFLLSSTNVISGYFELRMCRISALFDLVAHDIGIIIGSEDYDYIQRNVMKIHGYNLTASFLQEFEHYWYDLKMIPDVAVPLTPLGMDVLDYLWSNIRYYISENAFTHLDVKDPLDIAKILSDDAQRASICHQKF